MIRYRLPHEFDEFAFCVHCGSSEMAIEDGRKPRYCAKNRNFKSGRPSFAVWSMSKYRIVEELVDEGLYGDFSEVAEDLIASMIDDIGNTETPEQRAACMKWFDEVMLQGSGVVQFMPGRIHEADVMGHVKDPGVGFHGWAFPRIMVAAKDLYSFEDNKPPQEMPIPNYLQDPDTWYIKGSPEELAKLNLKVYDPFRYKFRERLSIDIAKPHDVVRKVVDAEFTKAGKPRLSAEEHCKYLCAWKGGGPCLADDCPRRQQHENGDGV